MKMHENVLKLAKEYRTDTAKVLSNIVKIPSLSGEEEKVVAALKEICQNYKFDEVYKDKLGNLIARVGNGPKKLAFDAHIDTVDVGDKAQWNFNPYDGEIDKEFVRGRGTVDQKGGAASMVTAGRILKELNYNGEYSVYFVFSVMEEDCDGYCWKHLIEKEKFKPDFVVLTEPTNLAIYRGHRGRVEIECHFKGLSAHGSAPERGENAIYKASRAALGVEKLHSHLSTDEFLGKGSVTVTQAKSESPSLCAVPDYAMLHLDRRLTWGETRDSSLSEVREAIKNEGEVKIPLYQKKSYTGEEARQEKYFPTWKIPEDHILISSGVKAFEQLFAKKPNIGKWIFSTNGVSICGEHKIPCMGFGPGNETFAHAPNEKIPIKDLEIAAALYASLPYVLEKGGN